MQVLSQQLDMCEPFSASQRFKGQIVKSGQGAICVALIAAALFGSATPLAKALLGSVDPFMLAGLFYLGSGAGLGLGIAWRSLMSPGSQPSTSQHNKKSKQPKQQKTKTTNDKAKPAKLMLGLSSTPAATSSLLL